MRSRNLGASRPERGGIGICLASDCASGKDGASGKDNIRITKCWRSGKETQIFQGEEVRRISRLENVWGRQAQDRFIENVRRPHGTESAEERTAFHPRSVSITHARNAKPIVTGNNLDRLVPQEPMKRCEKLSNSNNNCVSQISEGEHLNPLEALLTSTM